MAKKKKVLYVPIWGNDLLNNDFYFCKTEKEAVDSIKKNTCEGDDPATVYKVELVPIKKVSYKVVEEKIK